MASSAKPHNFHLYHSRGGTHRGKTHKPRIVHLSQRCPTYKIFSTNAEDAQVLSRGSCVDYDASTYLQELCLAGNLKDAIRQLDSMQELRIPVEDDAFAALVRLCEWKGAQEDGLRVYSCILNSKILFSVKLGNAILSMFVRFGNLTDAWHAFGKMAERDLFSWNVLLGGYAKQGFFDEALCLYHRMLWVGMKPDVYTFPCVLRTCAGIPSLATGREIHAHVIRYGFESDVDVVNALITMYSKCGNVVKSRFLFDRVPRRDRISWNAMISGYFENWRFYEGLKLFMIMRECSVDPDLMTMTSIISACEFLADERLGRAIHGYVLISGFGVDVSVCNSLIQMYLNIGLPKEAEKIFGRMKIRDIVSWTTMISGYESIGLPEKAIETYGLMEKEGVKPDEITIANVLSACATLNGLDMGLKLHELSVRTGLMSYVIVANTLIDMYSKCKCIDKALDVFHRIPNKNLISWTSIIVGLRINNLCFEALTYFRQMNLKLEPNAITLTSALAACARVGALICGKEIHAYILKTCLDTDDFLPNALLDMYIRCGRMKPALNLFNSQKRDVTTWNILMNGYSERNQGAQAKALFDRMIESEIYPDEITFISLLCACSRSGMVAEGLKYFNTMTEQFGIKANLKHYACVVDILGRAGQLRDAYEFIEKMPMEPDPAVWGALLNACRIHQRVELGELAAEKIFEKDRESVGYYILLCNLYVDCGRWNAVAKVRKLMQENGLTIDPGCSWVEVKGKVHAFLTGDDHHPQIGKINPILEGFYEKMNAAGYSCQKLDTMDEVEMSKADILCGHSERYAVVFGLINTVPGTPILINKNLYMCHSCHDIIKFISRVVRREISVRDAEQFHHFRDGDCSCGD